MTFNIRKALKELFRKEPEVFFSTRDVESLFNASIEVIEEKVESSGLSLALYSIGCQKTKYLKFSGRCVLQKRINGNTCMLFSYDRCSLDYEIFIELDDKPGQIFKPVINEIIAPSINETP